MKDTLTKLTIKNTNPSIQFQLNFQIQLHQDRKLDTGNKYK